jgi:putative transposase
VPEKREKARELMLSEKISLRIALRAMNLSKASYYHTPKPAQDRRCRPLDEFLVARLREVRGYELTYGYRKMTASIIEHNHKKVYRHMKALSMLQPRKLKKKATPRLPISCPVGSDVRWEGDLTYIWDGQKTNYLFVIVDAYDKEPMGDYYGLRCRAEEAVLSLEEAVRERFGSLEPYKDVRVKLRIDQGSQYVSRKFKERARNLGVKLEYCGIDCPNDKPYVESFFSRYKCEEVYRNEYRSYTDALLGWVQYKDWYRNSRLHQGLGFLSIPEFKNRVGSLLHPQFRSNNTGA